VRGEQYLIDTSALARLLRPDAEQHGWDRAAAAGLIAVCPPVELEFFRSARNALDADRPSAQLRAVFGWVPIPDQAFSRSLEVQRLLTDRGWHRSAGPVDLLIAATAELQGLTLLHRDRDYECIGAVTGQPLQWFGPSVAEPSDA
jgi:predicted nucleic acid-binding protein